MSEDWKIKHKEAITSMLSIINSDSDEYVLKGGTALMTCYGLDRFSEDIDLDSSDRDSLKYVQKYCQKNGATYRVAKDTETTTRYFIHYGGKKPLKIEISHRNKVIDKSLVKKINGITVYDIDAICAQKASAYKDRDKIRDLYDLGFIGKNYFNKLSPITKAYLSESLSHKGIQQFDYVLSQQEDELIDKDKMLENFLTTWDNLGLLKNEEDNNSLSNHMEVVNSEGDVWVREHERNGHTVKGHFRKRKA